jgi:hypothetical protein
VKGVSLFLPPFVIPESRTVSDQNYSICPLLSFVVKVIFHLISPPLPLHSPVYQHLLFVVLGENKPKSGQHVVTMGDERRRRRIKRFSPCLSLLLLLLSLFLSASPTAWAISLEHPLALSNDCCHRLAREPMALHRRDRMGFIRPRKVASTTVEEYLTHVLR